jgi:hypothetical protein
MLSDYRHWLEYDSVALAVLVVGIGLIELIVLRIWRAFCSRLRAWDVLRDRQVERMIPSNNISRVYDPHTLSIMAIAFDRACDFLPVQFRDSDYMRRKLASHIIRHVNDGESDPTRLADSAIVSIFW